MEAAERQKLEEEISAKQIEVAQIQEEVAAKDDETKRLQDEVEEARRKQVKIETFFIFVTCEDVKFINITNYHLLFCHLMNNSRNSHILIS